MTLTGTQLALLADAVRGSYTDVQTKASSLNAYTESLVSDDLERWEELRVSYLKLKGEVDLGEDDERAALFYSFRNILGFPFKSYVFDADMLELVEIEVGRNFG